MTPYYEADGITIFHGDCREMTAWLGADVLVTDPPYGIGWSRGANPSRYSVAHDGIEGDADTTVRDAALAAWGSKPGVVFGSFYAPFPTGVRQVLVWHKPDDAGVVGSTTGHRRDAEPVFLVGEWPRRAATWTSVMRSTQRSIKAIVATGHPHTKPVDVLRTLLHHSPVGAVADPFMGSGSTLLAAKQLGRRAIGVELDERYCEVAARRLAQGILDFGEAS